MLSLSVINVPVLCRRYNELLTYLFFSNRLDSVRADLSPRFEDVYSDRHIVGPGPMPW